MACAGALGPTIARDPARAQQAFEQGVSLASTGAHGDAILAFDSAIAADPLHGLAHLEKAESHLYTDDDRELIRKHLERAVELLPDNPRAHRRLGEVLAVQGEDARAIEEWRRALVLNPEMLDARIALATSLENIGDLEGARAELEIALKHSADNVRARVRLAEVLGKLGDSRAAAENVRTAAEKVGRSAALYRRAAQFYAEAGDERSADRMRKLADEIDPPPESRKLRDLPKAKTR